MVAPVYFSIGRKDHEEITGTDIVTGFDRFRGFTGRGESVRRKHRSGGCQRGGSVARKRSVGAQ
jgi:hypothetical protein